MNAVTSREGLPGASQGRGRQAIGLMATFAVLWVILEQVVGARLQGHYHLMQVVWCRYAAHLAIVVVLWGWRGPGRLWRTSRLGYQLSRSLLMLVMPFSFFLATQSGTPVGQVWATFWVSPLLIVVLAYGMIGERATRPQWVVAVLGAAIAAAMLATGGFPGPRAMVLPGIMALSFSAYVVMTRSLSTDSVLTNLFFTALGVFAALTPFVARVWITPSPSDAVVLFAIGAVGLVALFALDRATVHAPVSATAPILYLHVAAAAALSVVRGHVPGLRVGVGGMLLVGLVAYVWLSGSVQGDVFRAHRGSWERRAS